MLPKFLQSPRSRTALLLMAMVLAHVVPRAVALRGVDRMNSLHFGDMLCHLSNLERGYRMARLSPEQAAHPFFTSFPQLQYTNPIGWPPGVNYLTELWYGHLPPLSIWVVLLTNGVFSLVLLVGLAGLGRAMGSTRIGLWAGLLALLSPPLAGSTWFYSLDYPLVAMVVMGLLLLWHTNGLTRLHACVAFGAWCGLGVMVKTGFPIYIVPPAVWAMAVSLRCPERRWKTLGGAALSGVAALGLLYLVHDLPLRSVWEELSMHVAPSPGVHLAANIPRFTLEWLWALPKFALACFPAPLLLVALPGVALLHRPSTRAGAGIPSPRGLLLATFWGALLFMLVMDNKMERYLHPLYPLVCLATTWWAATRLPRRWRTAALAAQAGVYALILVVVHFHPTPWLLNKEPASSQLFLYDLRPPGHEALKQMRHSRYMASVEQIAGAMVQLARLDPRRRPLGITTRDGEATDLREVGGRQFLELAALVAAHRLNDRFLIPVDIHGGIPITPAMLLVYPKREAPGSLVRRFHQVGSRQLEIEGQQFMIGMYLIDKVKGLAQ